MGRLSKSSSLPSEASRMFCGFCGGSDGAGSSDISSTDAFFLAATPFFGGAGFAGAVFLFLETGTLTGSPLSLSGACHLRVLRSTVA